MVTRDTFRPVDLSPKASGYLDLIRSFAAMAVMLGHARGLYFVDYENIAPARSTIPVKLLYFLTGFGHQSVMVFFVLSGLLIASSILRNLSRSTWSWRNYAIDRCVRLYLVLVPGLLLGTLWDLIGIHNFNSRGIYSGPLVPFGDGVPANQLTASVFFANLAFLQTRFTSVLGSNGPLWSLFNEFWYYVLFPLLIAVILSARRRSATTLGYLGAAALAAWMLGGALSGFLIWLAGACIALTSRHFQFPEKRRLLAAFYTFVALALTMICLLAARANRGWMGSDLAVGMSFALLIHRIAQVRGPAGQSGLKLAKILAGFSYSLYVLHFPLLLLIRAWLLPVPAVRWQPDPSHLLMALGIVSGVTLYAFAVAQVTERRTSDVRAWVYAHATSIFR